VDMSPVG